MESLLVYVANESNRNRTHDDVPDEIHCVCCKKVFRDRFDNYKAHLVLHTRFGRKGRVPYHPLAERALAQIDEEMKRKKTGKITKKPSKARR
jgi:hypothetical protein